MKNIDQIKSELYGLLKKYGINNLQNATVLKTANLYNLKHIKNSTTFINLEKINNFRHVNKFHEEVNEQLETDQFTAVALKLCIKGIVENGKKLYNF